MKLPPEILIQILADPSLSAVDLFTVAKRLSKTPTLVSLVAATSPQWTHLAQDTFDERERNTTSPGAPCTELAAATVATGCDAFESRWQILPPPAKQALHRLAALPGHPPAVPPDLESDLQEHGAHFDVVLAAARSHLDTTSWMAPELFRETAIATALLAQPQPLEYPFYPHDLMHLGSKLGPRAIPLLGPLSDNDYWQLLTPKAGRNSAVGRHDLFQQALGRWATKPPHIRSAIEFCYDWVRCEFESETLEYLRVQDFDLMAALCLVDGMNIKHGTPALRDEPGLGLIAMTWGGARAIGALSASLRDNTDIVRAAVVDDDRALWSASGRLADDEQTVDLACEHGGAHAFLAASPRLKLHVGFVCRLARHDDAINLFFALCQQMQRQPAVMAAYKPAFLRLTPRQVRALRQRVMISHTPLELFESLLERSPSPDL